MSTLTAPMRHRSTWPVLLGFAAARFYLTFVACLALCVVVPVLARGWTPYTITSGSMTPTLHPGDVLLVEHRDPTDLASGTVITFRRGPRTVTHRIVDVAQDGYVTRGDANRRADSARVAPREVVGVGRLVVPLLGLPVAWLAHGQVLLLGGWVVATLFAVAGARRPRLRPTTPRRRSRGRSTPDRRRRTALYPGITLGLAAMVTAAFLPRTGSAFADTTALADNHLAAAASFATPTAYYLHDLPTPPTGDSTADLWLTADETPPTATVLHDYSTDLGPLPGRTVERSSSPSYTDPRTAVVWRTPTATAPVTLAGPARVTLWSRIDRPPPPHQGGAVVLTLDDVDPATGARTTVATVTVAQDPWGSDFAARTATLSLGHTLAAGHALDLHLRVDLAGNPTRPLEFAYDTVDHPATLVLPDRIP